MGFCKNFMRFALYIFNLILFCTSIALIVIGALLLKGISTPVLDQISVHLTASPIVVIVIGCVVFFVTFLGCCGANKRSQLLLYSYATILLIILAAELAVGIYTGVKWHDEEFQRKIQEGMRDSFSRNPSGFEAMQRDLKCCGVMSSSSYAIKIPDSCCFAPPCRSSNSYGGCYPKFISLVEDNSNIILGVGIGFAVIEVFGIIAACVIANKKD